MKWLGLLKFDDDKSILIITENGQGSKSISMIFNPHGRGTMGQKIYTSETDR